MTHTCEKPSACNALSSLALRLLTITHALLLHHLIFLRNSHSPNARQTHTTSLRLDDASSSATPRTALLMLLLLLRPLPSPNPSLFLTRLIRSLVSPATSLDSSGAMHHYCFRHPCDYH
jgi:hypothetical protein